MPPTWEKTDGSVRQAARIEDGAEDRLWHPIIPHPAARTRRARGRQPSDRGGVPGLTAPAYKNFHGIASLQIMGKAELDNAKGSATPQRSAHTMHQSVKTPPPAAYPRSSATPPGNPSSPPAGSGRRRTGRTPPRSPSAATGGAGSAPAPCRPRTRAGRAGHAGSGGGIPRPPVSAGLPPGRGAGRAGRSCRRGRGAARPSPGRR